MSGLSSGQLWKMTMLWQRARAGSISVRSLTTSACMWGRKPKVVFDGRFPLSSLDVGRYRLGGNKELAKAVRLTGLMAPQQPGYYKSGQFVFIPEMVPEFVVPDLTDFNLKPYVSYKVTNITQSEFTARDLFDAVYGKKIVDDFEDGKLDESNVIEKYTKLEGTS